MYNHTLPLPVIGGGTTLAQTGAGVPWFYALLAGFALLAVGAAALRTVRHIRS